MNQQQQQQNTMDLMQSQVELLIDLSSSILDSALRMKNIVQPRQSYWHDVMTSPEEIVERRHAALKRYRGKYYGVGVEDEVFQAEVEQKQQEKKLDLPVGSYYTVYPRSRLEFELKNGIIKEEELDTQPAEDEIDVDEQSPVKKRQKLV